MRCVFNEIINLGFRKLGIVGKTAAIRLRFCFHSLKCFEIYFFYAFKLWFCSADGGFHAKPNLYIEPFVGCLESNLASQYAAACNYHVFDIHW